MKRMSILLLIQGRGRFKPGDMRDIRQVVVHKLLVDKSQHAPCMAIGGEGERKPVYTSIDVVETEDCLPVP